jgi:preprotein translocase subunit SecF
MFPFIKYSKLWFVIGGTVVVLSVFVLFAWGLKLGIDFTGGSLMEINFYNNRPENSEIIRALESVDIKNVTLQKTGEKAVIVRTSVLTEDAHQKALEAIKNEFEKDNNHVIESRFEMIGPSISQQLRQRSIWAIILVCLGIIGYVAYAFRSVSRPIASWKYGALAIIALTHDVLFVMGVFAILGHLYGTEIDTAFVVAVLTVMGYSVNDTIVVFDRVRERLLKRTSESFSDLVNIGLNQTLFRSINTVLTTLLPLIALYLFGGATIHNFALALIIGVASGAYSSIFIAGPLLALVERRQKRA